MNPGYVLPRLIRHFMPDSLARLFLRRKIVIRPGLETLDPEAAVRRYCDALEGAGFSLQGRKVMVFGYGGNFSVGCELLRMGARHVILCDRFAPPDDERNRPLLPRFADYLRLENGRVMPNPGCITLLEADIRQAAASRQVEPVDLIVSSSVFEHLDDVAGITHALAQLTAEGGLGLHFIDLRDHFFRYPFEMLRYSTAVWKGWFNPGTNLNRFRVWDYRRVFNECFEQVQLTILQHDRVEFEKARPYIRKEFLSGDAEEDSATIIQVIVGGVRNRQ